MINRRVGSLAIFGAASPTNRANVVLKKNSGSILCWPRASFLSFPEKELDYIPTTRPKGYGQFRFRPCATKIPFLEAADAIKAQTLAKKSFGSNLICAKTGIKCCNPVQQIGHVSWLGTTIAAFVSSLWFRYQWKMTDGRLPLQQRNRH